MEIMPGLYQLRVPNPSSERVYLNSYLVQESHGWLMVDTGWNTSEALDAVGKGLKEIGLGFEDIKHIVVTHSHPDHYGLAGKLKQLCGAKLAVHQAEGLGTDSKYRSMDNFLGVMAQWLRRNGASAEELAQLKEASPGMKAISSFTLPDVFLQGGERISTGFFDFEVMWTPGHSPGHICLYEPAKKILLSGDHILPQITPNISLYPWSGGNPLGSYLTSLKQLKQLEIDLVLPGHEGIFTNLRQRIAELLQHHEQRKNAILRLIGGKPKTAYKVALSIPWTVERKEVSFNELSSMDKRMAIWETLAHLELLRSEEKVEKDIRDDIIFYTALEV
jgi:glyoxylase-like metal-dependent hydrolase (beta-lactamase superfamily II)